MRLLLITFHILCNLTRENLFGALAAIAHVKYAAPQTRYSPTELHKERMERMKHDMAKGVMPMNQERSILKYLESVYEKDVIITKSWLSNAIQMGTGAIQTLKFNFQQTNQKAGNLSNSTIDNLLNMVDTFEVTGFRLAMFTLPNTGAGSTQVNGNVGNAIKEYFPNPNVFFGNSANGIEYLNLNNVFNGALYIKIDSTVFFESMQLVDLLKTGTSIRGNAQSTVAITNNVANGFGGVIPWTSGDVRHIEMDCTPMFMLNGSGKNDININLFEAAVLCPTDVAPTAVTRINFVELQLLGFLCQGGAKQGVRKA